MRYCECEKPNESANPRRKGFCVCGGQLPDQDWLSTDRNLGNYFERMLESCFPAYISSGFNRATIPNWFSHFYRECSGRERAGRKKFHLAYLDRNNPAEALEEAADLSNYLYFEVLRRRRLGEDEEMDVALMGSWYAAKAYEAAMRLQTHTFKSLSEE